MALPFSERRRVVAGFVRVRRSVLRTAFIETLCEQAAENPNIWLVTADLGYSVLERFADQFPGRFVNVGVAEQNMIGVAAGLALGGKQVVAYSIVNFATLRCLEQIRNDVAYHNADVKVVGVGGGYAYGPQGYTHHGVEDLAVMLALPTLDVLAPADPVEARLATEAMLGRHGPCYLRLGKSGEDAVHAQPPAFERGKVIRCREGTDVLIVTTGGLLAEALAAAEMVAEDHSVAVWSCPWLRPLDGAAILEAARTYDIILSVEEAAGRGGLGSAIATILAGERGRTARLSLASAGEAKLNDVLSQDAARKKLRLDAAGLADRIRDLGDA